MFKKDASDGLYLTLKIPINFSVSIYSGIYIVLRACASVCVGVYVLYICIILYLLLLLL